MDKLVKRLLLFSFIPVLIGGLIYVGYRKETLLMFRWFELIGIMDIVEDYRNSMKIELPEFVIYTLPNGLWSFSFIYFIGLMSKGILRKILHVIAITIIIGFELLQLWFISGTFCLIDFFTNLFFIVLSYKLLKGLD